MQNRRPSSHANLAAIVPCAATLSIRKASPLDAAGIVAALEVIASERVHSAIDEAWTVAQETRYLESLSLREAFHVAVDEKEGIVGFQSLDLWSTSFPFHGTRRPDRNLSPARVARSEDRTRLVERHVVFCQECRIQNFAFRFGRRIRPRSGFIAASASRNADG